jgi:hypothetical protein
MVVSRYEKGRATAMRYIDPSTVGRSLAASSFTSSGICLDGRPKCRLGWISDVTYANPSSLP